METTGIIGDIYIYIDLSLSDFGLRCGLANNSGHITKKVKILNEGPVAITGGPLPHTPRTRSRKLTVEVSQCQCRLPSI